MYDIHFTISSVHMLHEADSFRCSRFNVILLFLLAILCFHSALSILFGSEGRGREKIMIICFEAT